MAWCVFISLLAATPAAAHARPAALAHASPAAPPMRRANQRLIVASEERKQSVEDALAAAEERLDAAPSNYKSLGDLDAGSAMFEKYSEVDEAMVNVRKIVMARKEPRKLLVQPVLQMDVEHNVHLKTFEASPTGMIESFVARFPAEDPALVDLYEAELKHMLD